MLARAITLIESSRGEDAELAQQIIDACLPKSGDSIRVGITGVPGAGKSTFIEALGNFLIGKGDRVAVLAVDPSSERSGGSILGDKTRMERLANSEMAFIRPSPAGGSLGGVARRTRETMILCEAAGFRTVLIETVGVGQSETLVHGMVDFFLLLMIAGAGDELQGIKRGIVEMADLLAINKADGDNVRAAERAKREFAQALHLFPSARKRVDAAGRYLLGRDGRGHLRCLGCGAAPSRANAGERLVRSEPPAAAANLAARSRAQSVARTIPARRGRQSRSAGDRADACGKADFRRRAPPKRWSKNSEASKPVCAC